MTTAAPNPLSFNSWVQNIGVMAVALTQETGGVYSFVDPPLQAIVPMILNYAELRISRDLDLLASQTSNLYTLTAGVNVFSLPVNDFQVVQTLEIVTLYNGTVVNSQPLTPVSKEFIQNCFGGLTSADTPRYFAMYGDNFGDEQDSYTNILFGPPPNYAYSLRVTGTALAPSLYQSASSGPADSVYTYISQWYPDLLIMASMVYVSAFQRNFSAASDDVETAMTYEKQYQALRLGAVPLENRRKQMGSGWTAYSTPIAATPTR
jgi:hypothetical protein